MTDWGLRYDVQNLNQSVQSLAARVKKLESENLLLKQQIKPKTMQDLKDVEIITEANKQEWINWLGETIDYVEQGNYVGNYNKNRVFGTDKDDADEALNVLRTMFLTLQKSTLTTLTMLLVIFSLISCNNNPPVVYSRPAVVVQQPVQPVVQAADPYEVYQDGNGGQVVYYHDPNTGLAYYLEYSLFMSMWNTPNRYYTINHYYTVHRSYIDHNYTRYHNYYTRRSSTTVGRSNNTSAPTRQSSTSIGRTSSPAPMSRPSAPMRSSTPSSSRSSFRSSSPARRH